MLSAGTSFPSSQIVGAVIAMPYHASSRLRDRLPAFDVCRHELHVRARRFRLFRPALTLGGLALGRTPSIGLQLAVVVAFVAVNACKDDAPTGVAEDDDAGGSIGGFGRDKDGGAKVEIPCTKDPSYYDVPGDECDNDNDGVVDNPPTCDTADDPSPAVAMARSLGICDDVAKRGFGLVSAKLTRGFGRNDPAIKDQQALVGKFGNVIVPREGKKMALLSTGYAKEFDGIDGADFSGVAWEPQPADSSNGLPPGFPKPADGCPTKTDTKDVIALHLELKSPKNSSGFAFDFDFYTAEWPQFICTAYNDGFIAFVTAKAGAQNVSFDSKGNPVSVNNGFFDRCTPNVHLACGTANETTSKCAGGTGELGGTGFGIEDKLAVPGCADEPRSSTKGGATGWLSSVAAVGAEETFTVDFILWDTQDSNLDSSILLDNFRWVLGNVPAVPVTERPPDVK